MRVEKGLHSLEVGKLTVCWRDAWTGRFGLEVGWDYGRALALGFGSLVRVYRPEPPFALGFGECPSCGGGIERWDWDTVCFACQDEREDDDRDEEYDQDFYEAYFAETGDESGR